MQWKRNLFHLNGELASSTRKYLNYTKTYILKIKGPERIKARLLFECHVKRKITNWSFDLPWKLLVNPNLKFPFCIHLSKQFCSDFVNPSSLLCHSTYEKGLDYMAFKLYAAQQIFITNIMISEHQERCVDCQWSDTLLFPCGMFWTLLHGLYQTSANTHTQTHNRTN